MFIKVYKSETAHNTRNPFFKAFKVKGSILCNSDKSTPIKLVFYNKGENYRKEIGECVGPIE
jgi:hypothetical protein